MPKGKRVWKGMHPHNRAKFRNFVNEGEPDECWEWKGLRDNKGAPHNFIRGNGRSQDLQRVCYQAYGNFLHRHHRVLNTCGYEHCCNPAHLYADPFQGNTRAGYPEHSPNSLRVKMDALNKLAAKYSHIKTDDDLRALHEWDFYEARIVRDLMYRVNGYKPSFSFKRPWGGGRKYVIETGKMLKQQETDDELED